MFSFVIYDQKKKLAFAARDRFGEKPFYYCQNDDEFVFASEIKALATYFSSLTVNKKAVSRYLIYDLVENPDDKGETFFEDIYSLPPSHYMSIDEQGSSEIVEYWKIQDSSHFKESIDQAIPRFQKLLNQSVSRRLRSDVSLGSSLSGGLDSSSILAEIDKENQSDFNSFTARFEDEQLDEGAYIDLLSKKYKFNSNDVWPSKANLIKELSTIFYHQEEPFGSSSIFAQWEVFKMAKKKEVTVLLDGQGADEVLGGYEKYIETRLGELLTKNIFSIFKNYKIANRIPGVSISLGNIAQGLFPAFYDKLRNSWLSGKNKNPLINGLGEELKSSSTQISNPFKSFKHLNDALFYDSFKYGLGKLLRFSDKNSMAHSREVRLPFLSHELVEFTFSLPSEMKIKLPWTKYILRRSMNGELPEEICWRKDKKGFAPPQKNWMKSVEIKELVEKSANDLIDQKIISDPSVFNGWQIIMTAELIKFSKRFSPEHSDGK